MKIWNTALSFRGSEDITVRVDSGVIVTAHQIPMPCIGVESCYGCLMQAAEEHWILRSIKYL